MTSSFTLKRCDQAPTECQNSAHYIPQGISEHVMSAYVRTWRYWQAPEAESPGGGKVEKLLNGPPHTGSLTYNLGIKMIFN